MYMIHFKLFKAHSVTFCYRYPNYSCVNYVRLIVLFQIVGAIFIHFEEMCFRYSCVVLDYLV